MVRAGWALLAAGCACVRVEWTQTARNSDGSLVLLRDMAHLSMGSLDGAGEKGVVVDRGTRHQTFEGFGGAFTAAAAINWRSLTPADQAELIHLYFDAPDAGGLGYTMGRVPINSCDFTPASYNFDDTDGDVGLQHFDANVTRDVENGMVPMIQAAQAAVRRRGLELKLLASPWSPPAWMKLPVHGVAGDPGTGLRSMTLSANPNGLDPAMQRPWASYFSRWISAYRAHGIRIWGVTVQNEPEATAGWEAMLWTAQFMADFVREHLGPVLAADHPHVSIWGFDHNKDHVADWARVLYADPGAAKYLAGVGVHWYGGLQTDKLQEAHEIAPEKRILATEACNCVGNVVYSSPSIAAWWTRAERLAIDILEDLRFWTVRAEKMPRYAAPPGCVVCADACAAPPRRLAGSTGTCSSTPRAVRTI